MPRLFFLYDVASDELKRNSDGFCSETAEEEPGLLAVKISPDAPFNGYTDKKESEKKILRDVLEKGDAWFNSGDLIKRMDVGFALGQTHYQFVDRVGDTFRWKSENVSTNEVAEILNQSPEVNMANVYGVKVTGCEGRAGMVTFNQTPGKDVNWADLSSFIAGQLPSYARPLFIRVTSKLDTTGTFKLKKNDLREEAFHLDKVDGDIVYVKKPGSNDYVPLDNDFYELIQNDQAGF